MSCKGNLVPVQGMSDTSLKLIRRGKVCAMPAQNTLAAMHVPKLYKVVPLAAQRMPACKQPPPCDATAEQCPQIPWVISAPVCTGTTCSEKRVRGGPRPWMC